MPCPAGGCEFAIDFVCWIEVLQWLRTAIITSDFMLRARRRRILLTYLRSWAVLDLAAAVPWLTLIEAPLGLSERRRLLFRLLRMFKLAKLPHVMAVSDATEE